MEVILKQDLDKLGKAGAVVKVKDGFARNFLIPNNLALPMTSANLKNLEQENKRKALRLEKIKQEAEAQKAQLDSLSLTIPAAAGEEDKLYGSITAGNIASALGEEGFQVDKDSILLDEPIKSLGIYEILIKLHTEVSAKIKVWVVKQ